jgi:FMN phosphatase YigB (HAD superfamily)
LPPHLRKPVVFIDFHGTICHDRYWRSLPDDRQARLAALLFGADTRLVYEWMRGQHTAEAINRIVAAHLDLPYDELWQSFVSDCRTMHVSPATLARIARLRQRATVILITGNMDSFTRFTVPALGLDTAFDAIANSWHERRLKTDDGGAAFLDHASRHGIPIENCLVIDDAADVCATFSALGGTAMQVTPSHNIDDILDALLV